METVTPSALANAAGISVPYASQILSAKRRPARSLAIHIFRKTGWRHPLIADLDEDQLVMLEQIEPWSPAEQSAAA